MRRLGAAAVALGRLALVSHLALAASLKAKKDGSDTLAAPALRVLADPMVRPLRTGITRRLRHAATDALPVLAQLSSRRVDYSGSVARATASSAAGAGSSSKDPISAAFFGSFSESESTYSQDVDGKTHPSENPEVAVLDGWEYRPDNPDTGGVRAAKWFHESASAGDKQAFQTHYPALQSGVSGRGAAQGQWHVTGGGHWTQDYLPSSAERDARGTRTSQWFDSSIKQYDGFGRPRAPDLHSSKRLNGWQEQTVNTTMSCATAGCVANTTLQAFNGTIEEASNCRLSFHLHPTDFDDQYSGERLTFISVNDVTVNTDCFPMVSGCNATTQKVLFPCLHELPLDTIIDTTGTLRISAQISDVVDECPFEGNLLAGVPTVTCMVAPKRTSTSLHVRAPARPALPMMPATPEGPHFIHARLPLRCPERGCSARAEFRLNSTELTVKQCLLSVRINQTDFDGEQGTLEQLEYVKVDDVTLASNMTPGKNPCRSAWAGTPLTLAEIEHTVLTDHDVTANATDGALVVVAKITDHVDECAHDGYLLNGYVEVNCTVANRDGMLSNASGISAANASARPVVGNTSASAGGAVNTSVPPLATNASASAPAANTSAAALL